ncbi:MAG: leucine-rich repeat domain-containing protein, partial [Lachnospiraceae bacterium]|nr:leucine-rich repeat domain-containing protein [Lachnospiraceae bacterium]
GALLPEYRAWYIRLLIDHFAQAPQFMPEDPKQPDPFAALFSALMETGDLTAGDVSSLIRTAGEEHLSSALLNEMMRVRTESFSMATGFEDLEI